MQEQTHATHTEQMEHEFEQLRSELRNKDGLISEQNEKVQRLE